MLSKFEDWTDPGSCHVSTAGSCSVISVVEYTYQSIPFEIIEGRTLEDVRWKDFRTCISFFCADDLAQDQGKTAVRCKNKCQT